MNYQDQYINNLVQESVNDYLLQEFSLKDKISNAYKKGQQQYNTWQYNQKSDEEIFQEFGLRRLNDRLIQDFIKNHQNSQHRWDASSMTIYGGDDIVAVKQNIGSDPSEYIALYPNCYDDNLIAEFSYNTNTELKQFLEKYCSVTEASKITTIDDTRDAPDSVSDEVADATPENIKNFMKALQQKGYELDEKNNDTIANSEVRFIDDKGNVIIVNIQNGQSRWWSPEKHQELVGKVQDDGSCMYGGYVSEDEDTVVTDDDEKTEETTAEEEETTDNNDIKTWVSQQLNAEYVCNSFEYNVYQNDQALFLEKERTIYIIDKLQNGYQREKYPKYYSTQDSQPMMYTAQEDDGPLLNPQEIETVFNSLAQTVEPPLELNTEYSNETRVVYSNEQRVDIINLVNGQYDIQTRDGNGNMQKECKGNVFLFQQVTSQDTDNTEDDENITDNEEDTDDENIKHNNNNPLVQFINPEENNPISNALKRLLQNNYLTKHRQVVNLMIQRLRKQGW